MIRIKTFHTFSEEIKVKKMNLRNKQDDRGFSLIELIVSILIMSVISAMVILLISSSRATYSEVNTDAVLQGDAETVRKFIGELALEARSWGEKTVNLPGGDSYKLIWIKALDNDTEGLERGSYDYTYYVDEDGDGTAETEKNGSRLYYYYVFLLRSPDGPLAYGKYKYDTLVHNGELFGDGFTFPTVVGEGAGGDYYHNDILTSPYAILAEHVTDIKCSIAADNNDRELISIDLTLNYNGHGYTTKMNFAGRNKTSATE